MPRASQELLYFCTVCRLVLMWQYGKDDAERGSLHSLTHSYIPIQRIGSDASCHCRLRHKLGTYRIQPAFLLSSIICSYALRHRGGICYKLFKLRQAVQHTGVPSKALCTMRDHAGNARTMLQRLAPYLIGGPAECTLTEADILQTVVGLAQHLLFLKGDMA